MNNLHVKKFNYFMVKHKGGHYDFHDLKEKPCRYIYGDIMIFICTSILYEDVMKP